MSDTSTGAPGTGAGHGSSRTDLESAAEVGRDLRDTATSKLRETGEAAMSEAHHRAEAAKSGAADEISSIGKALRKASGEMRHGSPQERTFASVADALADVSDSIRGKDLGEMVDDIGQFARRNPVAFLGGAALLGFAAARMARASARNRTPAAGDYSTSATGDYAQGGYGQGGYGAAGSGASRSPASRNYIPQGETAGPAVTPGSASTGSASAGSASAGSASAGSASTARPTTGASSASYGKDKS